MQYSRLHQSEPLRAGVWEFLIIDWQLKRGRPIYIRAPNLTTPTLSRVFPSTKKIIVIEKEKHQWALYWWCCDDVCSPEKRFYCWEPRSQRSGSNALAKAPFGKTTRGGLIRRVKQQSTPNAILKSQWTHLAPTRGAAHAFSSSCSNSSGFEVLTRDWFHRWDKSNPSAQLIGCTK